MANAITIDRRNRLAQILVSEGSVKVGKLAELFDVSTETIRKDLIYLEKEGIARKGHGGAIVSSDLVERPFSLKVLENLEAKTKIAQAAIEMVPKNGVVILDAGSTTLSIAKQFTIKKGYTIITNSISITYLLSGTENKVFSLGGEARSSSMALIGLWATNALNMVKADIAFLGADGFLSCNGPCTAAYEEAEIKKAMIKSSKKTIITCDSNKFKVDSMFQFCEWKDIDCLITDNNVSESRLNELENKVRIILV